MMIFFLFALTMFFIYWRPFNLPLWVFSTLGALAAFVLGLVSVEDMLRVWAMVEESTLTLVGLILLTLALEKIGFFTYLSSLIIGILAQKEPKKEQMQNALNHLNTQIQNESAQILNASHINTQNLTSQNKAQILQNLNPHIHSHTTNTPKILKVSTAKFYIFLILFSTFLSAFFANDGAILILTPLVLALFSASHLYQGEHSLNCASFFTPLIFFLLLVSFVSDFASNIFVISNLTNIITAQFFGLESTHFTWLMLLPQIFVIMGALSFWFVLKRFLPKMLHFAPTKSTFSCGSILFCFSLLLVLLFGIFYAHKLHLPLYFFTFICAFLAIVYGKILRKMQFFASLKDAPFGIVFFSLGLFIVVYGLKNGGILSFLTEALPLFASFSKQVQILCFGFASSIGSSVMNNLPMVMLGNLALADLRMQLETFNALIFAHLLGCNIGAKLTPIGSLATLLWLSRLKAYGIQLGFLRYMVAAFLITLPLLLLGLCGLICWEYFA